MKFCYVSGKEKTASAKKAWKTRRRRFGWTGGNLSGPKDMSGCKTAKYRKAASERSVRMWSDPKFKAAQTKRLRAVGKQISTTLKHKYKDGSLTHWSKTEKAMKIRDKMKVQCKKGWDRFKTTENYGPWKRKLLDSHYRRPTKLEKKIQQLNIPHLEYTGDSNFWIHLKTRAKNPDFVVRPFRKTKTVVELFGAIGFYHFEKEIQPLIDEYKEAGITCLVLREGELKNLELVKTKLLDLVHIKLGCIGETPTPEIGQEDNPEATCESRESVETIRQASLVRE